MTGLGLCELYRRVPDGECLFCGEPTRAKNPRTLKRRPRGEGRTRASDRTHYLTCGDPVCATAYLRLWRRDERAALKEAAQ